jgi:hypothetical protein
LTVADDFGREAVDIAVDQAARFRGYPCAVQ